MSGYTFAQLRLQFIELADLESSLSDRAFRLVLHLIVRHLNRTDGTCHVDDKTLAAELGCSTDTISRAVACVERSGLLVVTRGRRLRASNYSISAKAWKAAEGLRRTTSKSAEQVSPQSCSGYPAKQPINTPQISGTFYRNEIRENSAGTALTSASTSSDPALCGMDRMVDVAPLLFVALKSFPMKMWNERLEDFGLPHIERWMSRGATDGKLGFLLPALWPASKESSLWQDQLAFLRSQYRESQRSAEERHVL